MAEPIASSLEGCSVMVTDMILPRELVRELVGQHHHIYTWMICHEVEVIREFGAEVQIKATWRCD